ncbi:Fic family protein, partial [PVC group bacterium]|nr:Fic family protein [PVC group bacterium]
LVSPYTRKEAVSSSRIEGTQATIQELFYYESSSFAKETGSDVMEVANYVKAIEFGINALEKLPISIRLIKNIHKILMEGVRGNRATPGELRKSQNWIGTPNSSIDNVTYVPPPVDAMKESLYRFEKYLHVNSDDPLLIRCALIHYQLEAIHPFLDGNGRVGRLLVVLFLCAKGVLPTPLLYLSAYFELLRDEYYRQLLRVSTTGDWNAWLRFFLRGVDLQARYSRPSLSATRWMLPLPCIRESPCWPG